MPQSKSRCEYEKILPTASIYFQYHHNQDSSKKLDQPHLSKNFGLPAFGPNEVSAVGVREGLKEQGFITLAIAKKRGRGFEACQYFGGFDIVNRGQPKKIMTLPKRRLFPITPLFAQNHHSKYV